MDSQVVSLSNPPANARDVSDAGLTAGWGRSPGGGHNSPLQCSCLENVMAGCSSVGHEELDLTEAT